ncbi:MAG: protease modulator HflC [Parvularculales bacterium]
MNRLLVIIGVVVAVIAVVAYASLFTVNETQQALVLQFGDPKDVKETAGLHIKLPFIQNVVYIDKRILNLTSSSEEVIASDQKRLVVDAFARYKIIDPLEFYKTLGSIQAAESRLSTLLSSSLRSVLGKESFVAVVRDQRAELMQRIRALVNQQAQSLGIEIVDVRIRRADLPEANSQAIFRRMQTERQQEAAEIRAIGQQDSREIRAQADKEVTVILADANRDAEIIRGEGDGCRNRIFAAAYGQDPDFFAFYRSMQSYEEALNQGDTALVLSPDSEFFRFFRDPNAATEHSSRVPRPQTTSSSLPDFRAGQTLRSEFCPEVDKMKPEVGALPVSQTP